MKQVKYYYPEIVEKILEEYDSEDVVFFLERVQEIKDHDMELLFSHRDCDGANHWELKVEDYTFQYHTGSGIPFNSVSPVDALLCVIEDSMVNLSDLEELYDMTKEFLRVRDGLIVNNTALKRLGMTVDSDIE